MVSPKATVKPILLEWARQSIGYDVVGAAKKVGVKPETLTGWEAGTGIPTIKQLRKCALVYKRPLAVFYLQEPPRDFEALRDFRTVVEYTGAPYSPRLQLAIREAHERRAQVLDFATLLDESVSNLTMIARLDEETWVVANRIRETLGAQYTAQFALHDEYDAIRYWRSLIEAQQILVFQFDSVDVREARGFSIHNDVFPVVAINAADSPYGRVFTLLHELTHLLLGAMGVCDLDPHEGPGAHEVALERFCNDVAALVLMPYPEFESDEIVQRLSSGSSLDLQITALSRKWRVSPEALVLRLVQTKRVSWDFYFDWRTAYYADLAEKKARDREKQKEEGGFLPPYRRAFWRNGAYFNHLVMTAYHQDLIGIRDIVHYLDVKPKHLDRIETMLKQYVA